MNEGAQCWGISDVERLVGLPRRYIQRACYTGKDGAGILAPATKGRDRAYGVRDLATLLAVSLLRDERYSRDHQRHTLGEVRDAIADQNGDVEQILQAESELLSDQIEETASQYLRVRALVAALSPCSAKARLSSLLSEIEAVDNALGPNAELALRALPGTDLARELYRSFVSATDGDGASGDRPCCMPDEPAEEID